MLKELQQSDSDSAMRNSYEPESVDDSFHSDDESEDFRPRKSKGQNKSVGAKGRGKAGTKSKNDGEESSNTVPQATTANNKRKPEKSQPKKDIKKVKKNENKDIIMAQKNVLQYHLFH